MRTITSKQAMKEFSDSQSKMTVEEHKVWFAEHIKTVKIVDPPLTQEQIDQVSSLLRKYKNHPNSVIAENWESLVGTFINDMARTNQPDFDKEKFLLDCGFE